MSKRKKSSFNKLLVYAKPHQGKLFFVCFWAVFLAIISAFRPFLLNFTIDNYLIEVKKETNVIQQYFEGLMLSIFPGNDNFSNLKILVIIMFVALLLEAISQFYFTYIANWLGQDIIKDLRNKLYDHITSFKMKYFDNEPVGKLVTRSVSDIESIASIFSQGLFMIISDVLKMIIVIAFMLIVNWKITGIVLAIMPIILIATNIFNKKMKVAFNEVRNEIAKKMAYYSGLSEKVVLEHNLAVPTGFFWKELLRDQGMTIGRLDSRYRGIDKSDAGERYDFDPALTSWNHAFAPAFQIYAKNVLKFNTDLTYNLFGPVHPWDRSNETTGYDLGTAMRQNPYLHLMVQSGYFDGGTDFFNAKYSLWQIDPAGKMKSRIDFKGYRSGHMMYLRAEDLAKSNEDIRQFIQKSAVSPNQPARYK